MIALYETDTGTLVSVGSVVADPVPEGLTAVEVDDSLLTGHGYWDEATRTVILYSPTPEEIAAEAETTTAAVKAIKTDLQEEKAKLDVIINKTNAQIGPADTKDVARSAKRIADAAIELSKFVQ